MAAAALVFGLCRNPVHAESPGEDFLLRYYESREQWPDSFKGPYPVYPGVFFRGEFRKLAGVEVNRPYFFQNGMKRFIHSSAEITFLPYSDFYNVSTRLIVKEDFALGEGAVETVLRPATQWIAVPKLEGGVRRSLTAEIELEPDRNLDGAFLAIVFHDDDFNSEVFWKQIGSVSSGENRLVKLVTDPLPRDGRYPHNFILVFTSRGEVVTQRRLEIGESLAALSFRWMQNFIADYVDLNSDHAVPVLPIHQGAVSFLTQNGRFITGSVNIRATVDRYGFARDARVTEISNELLAASAIPMVQRWLFFPKLDGGEAVDSEVAIPINYRSRSSR